MATAWGSTRLLPAPASAGSGTRRCYGELLKMMGGKERLARLGVAANETLALEDTEPKLKSARAAGLDCLISGNEHTRYEDFAGAVSAVKDLRDAMFESVPGGLEFSGTRP